METSLTFTNSLMTLNIQSFVFFDEEVASSWSPEIIEPLPMEPGEPQRYDYRV